jgi:hypothetical protein
MMFSLILNVSLSSGLVAGGQSYVNGRRVPYLCNIDTIQLILHTNHFACLHLPLPILMMSQKSSSPNYTIGSPVVLLF